MIDNNKKYNDAYKILRKFENDENIIQEVIVKLFEIDNIYDKKRGAYSTFIVSVYRNFKIDMYRRKKDRHIIEVEFIDEIDEKYYKSNVVYSDEKVREEYIKEKLNILKKIANENLIGKQREVILLLIEGFAIEEIEKKLNITYNNFKTLKSRAIKKLKKNGKFI